MMKWKEIFDVFLSLVAEHKLDITTASVLIDGRHHTLNSLFYDMPT